MFFNTKLRKLVFGGKTVLLFLNKNHYYCISAAKVQYANANYFLLTQ